MRTCACLPASASTVGPDRPLSCSTRHMPKRGRDTETLSSSLEALIDSQQARIAQFLATQGADTILLSSIFAGQQEIQQLTAQLVEQRQASDSVRCVQFSPKGDTIVSGSKDRTLKIWDVALGTCKATLAGHRYLSLLPPLTGGEA